MLFIRIYSAFIGWLVCLKVTALVMSPGPQHTETYLGRETFIVGHVFRRGPPEPWRYPVRDYGDDLRPKVVYNCNIVRSLCRNARQYLGPGVNSAFFHYDADQDEIRNEMRRSGLQGSCGGAWRAPNPITGQPRCPEPDQPTFDMWSSNLNVKRTEDANVVWHNGQPSPSFQLGFNVTMYDHSTNPVSVRRVQRNFGIALTCDEFPAASWIEGGQPRPQDPAPKAASTYCTPQSTDCDEDPESPWSSGVVSEQNWQAFGFSSIQSWFSRLAGRSVMRNRDYYKSFSHTIFKFKFEMVTDSDDDSLPAVWLEARGIKRYCYGPRRTADYGCTPQAPKDNPDPAPDNTMPPVPDQESDDEMEDA